MVNDPVADFIIQLKNAGAVKKESVLLPYSKMKHAIADKLAALGYVEEATIRGKKIKKNLEVVLQYKEGVHTINGVQRISKPGRRLYVHANEIHPVKFGKGKMILSTPSGILTGEEAKEKNVGGEQLFTIW